jgi:hypothetical protein
MAVSAMCITGVSSVAACLLLLLLYAKNTYMKTTTIKTTQPNNTVQTAYGRDGRDTHGQDARATIKRSAPLSHNAGRSYNQYPQPGYEKTMITDQTRLRMASDVTHQSLGVDQDTVVLSLSSGYLYTCNATAAAFLTRLDGQKTFAQVTDLLEQEFDVPRSKLRADLLALAENLLREKLVLVAE